MTFTKFCSECGRNLARWGHQVRCTKRPFHPRSCYHTRVSRNGNCLSPGCGAKGLPTTFAPKR